MERYFYLPYGSGNLAKPVKLFEEAKAAAEAWVQAQTPAQEPVQTEVAEPEETINVDAILNAKEEDLDALVAGLGIV